MNSICACGMMMSKIYDIKGNVTGVRCLACAYDRYQHIPEQVKKNWSVSGKSSLEKFYERSRSSRDR